MHVHIFESVKSSHVKFDSISAKSKMFDSSMIHLSWNFLGERKERSEIISKVFFTVTQLNEWKLDKVW